MANKSENVDTLLAAACTLAKKVEGLAEAGLSTKDYAESAESLAQAALYAAQAEAWVKDPHKQAIILKAR